MEFRKFKEKYIIRLNKGDEVISSITDLCRKENIKLGSFVGLGAANKATIGLYDTENKLYHQTTMEEPMEITSLVGNISTFDDEVYLHVHINLCNKDMQIFGGHLNECFISATSEITLLNIEGKVEREYDEETGLNLYKFL
ncbi:PPC domain-containing DNA-binding protein [Anaerofustis stercorihominis]|uniref:PPC domain-containing DNA-binding protein n=1 Tax=Anaerofustis stercorihominis TaxID=214853 RepID=UPI00214B9A32|nr:PPC domain-containing DNA-binding protein [Anaerofustis stercorihominis]MCR2032696.1 DNA-binding protein [Anaerofustis stercorihominis]